MVANPVHAGEMTRRRPDPSELQTHKKQAADTRSTPTSYVCDSESSKISLVGDVTPRLQIDQPSSMSI